MAAKKTSGKKWIQKGIKRPGRMKKYCGGKVTCDCLDRAAKSKNRSLRSAANLGKRLKGCKGSKPIGRRKRK